jgi:hypothetical protein
MEENVHTHKGVVAPHTVIRPPTPLTEVWTPMVLQVTLTNRNKSTKK